MRLNRKVPVDGFTLVDLMVVLAAVCVIGCLLLPSLTGGKPKPERINCRNNLKQIGLAKLQWANDNNGHFPAGVSKTNGGAMEAVLATDVAAVFRIMSNHLGNPKLLFCQADQRRKPAATFGTRGKGIVPFLNNSSVSYFIGLDAAPTQPQTLLTGDDNWLIGGRDRYNGLGHNGVPVTQGILLLGTNTLVAWSEERHSKQGNVALADGSVQGLSNSRLNEALRTTGMATNRLVFP